MPSLKAALLDLARANPLGVGPGTFVFWASYTASRPEDRLIDGLRDGLVRLSLTGDDLKDKKKVAAALESWKARRIVFHSWCHYFAACMADRLEKRKVMLATGHANGAVFDAYADHGTNRSFTKCRRPRPRCSGSLSPFRANPIESNLRDREAVHQEDQEGVARGRRR